MLITWRASSGIAAGRCRREEREWNNWWNQWINNEIKQLFVWWNGWWIWWNQLMNGARASKPKRKVYFSLLVAAANGIHEFICFCLLLLAGVMGASSAMGSAKKRERRQKTNEWMNGIEELVCEWKELLNEVSLIDEWEWIKQMNANGAANETARTGALAGSRMPQRNERQLMESTNECKWNWVDEVNWNEWSELVGAANTKTQTISFTIQLFFIFVLWSKRKMIL